MGWVPFKKKYPIFVVFQDDCIRYVKLKHHSPLIIHKIGEKMLPPGVIQEGRIVNKKVLTQVLNKSVNEWKIKGKQVRFAIPDSISVIRKIPVPSIIPEKEINGYVQVELGASIHIPFDEPVFDLHKLHRNEESVEYLLFAAPESVMNEYVSVLEETTLRPIDAELSSLASYRLFYCLDLIHSQHHYLSLQLDKFGINATAFHQHVPLFTRYIPLVSHENVSEEFRLTANSDEIEGYQIEERWNEIVTEVDRVMNFYQFSLSDGSEAFDSLIVTGDHTQTKQFSEQAESYFNMPVIQIPEGKVLLERGLQVPIKFYTAVGLGFKGSDGHASRY